jgi:[ribosomal protein S18]-alanine N-acetyltransferase
MHKELLMTPSSAQHLEVRTFAREHVKALRTFLLALQVSGEEAWFHPHPFSVAYLRELSTSDKRDTYLVALWGKQVVAYGMLRGWDEGYKVPSLGLAVHPDFRKQSLGRMMMLVLQAAARLRGARQIRLKVYKSNVGARKLYKSLGYRLSSFNEEEWIGYLDLP